MIRLGPCKACGGKITAVRVPMWRETFPGQVEYRCRDCDTLEPPSARRPDERQCYCGAWFAARRGVYPKRYCSPPCKKRVEKRPKSARGVPTTTVVLATASPMQVSWPTTAPRPEIVAC